MSDTTYKSKVGYKPPVELEYHEGMPEIKSVSVKILDQVEERVVAQCSAAVGMKIDREELIKALRYDRGQYEKGYADGKRDAAAAIEALQALLPKRGKWIMHPEVKNIYGGVYIECPFCGEKYVVQNVSDEKFCRNCGADMSAKMEEVQE